MSNDTGAEREEHRRSPPHPEPINVGSAQGTNLVPLGTPKRSTSTEDATNEGLQHPSNEEKKNSAKTSNEDDNSKTKPSMKEKGQKQKETSNEEPSKESSVQKSKEEEFPDTFEQPFHLNDDGTVDTSGAHEKKIALEGAETPVLDGNICHPAISFPYNKEGTIDQSISKYRLRLQEHVENVIANKDNTQRYIDTVGGLKTWGMHADPLINGHYHSMTKLSLERAMDQLSLQMQDIRTKKALTLDVALQLQKVHDGDQKVISELHKKIQLQDELIKSLTLKSEYNEAAANGLKVISERQAERLQLQNDEIRALRKTSRHAERIHSEELLSTFKPYEEVVKNVASLKKADSSKEDSSQKYDPSKKEGHQKGTALPTNVTFEEFIRMASPSRSRSRTQTPPLDDQDVIDVDSSPEDAQNDNEDDQSGQQNDDGQLAVNSEGQVVESLNEDNTVPAFSYDPRNILETDCTSEEDGNRLSEREASPACVDAFGRARRWSKMTKFRNWLEHTPSDLEKTASTPEGRRYLFLELEHLQKYLDWANARKYRSASSPSVQSFMSEFQKDRASNGTLKDKYMFLGAKAGFKLRKFAAFDPDTPVIFSYQERIRLIRAALDDNMSSIHLEYFKLFGNRPDKRLSDERFPDHKKPVVPLERLYKRSRSPREKRPPPKRQQCAYVPSARQEHEHPLQQRRTLSSYRAGHRRNGDKNSRSPPRDSRRKRAPTQDSDQRANETARKHIEERANQIARTIVANPNYLRNYPTIPKMDLDTTMTLLRISKAEAKDKQYEHYRLHLILYLDRRGSPPPQRPANHHQTSRRTSREEYPRRRDMRSRSPSQGYRPH